MSLVRYALCGLERSECQLTFGQIKIANEIGVPFLAVTGTHGWTDDISRIQDGIQIRMRGLNHVTLSPSKDTAYAGGGVIQYEVLQALYRDGKQAGNDSHALFVCNPVTG